MRAYVEGKEADDERGAVGDHMETIGDERQRVDREANDKLDEEEAEDKEKDDEHPPRAPERAPTPREPVQRAFVRVVVVMAVARVRAV